MQFVESLNSVHNIRLTAIHKRTPLLLRVYCCCASTAAARLLLLRVYCCCVSTYPKAKLLSSASSPLVDR
jgi:hypothetical protein